MKSSQYSILPDINNEVHDNLHHIHPQINQLIQAFLKYLKEPRYQSPLTLPELARLFLIFYKDLLSLTINIYSQTNSNKRQLLSNSKFFKLEPKKFDYLIAISNYSSSSIKLLKRNDPHANLQLRVFNYYKFVTIFDIFEHSQYLLFNSINNKSLYGNNTSLYDKIFRFNQRDITVQALLDDKLLLLQQLKLPFSCFSESDLQNKNDSSLNTYFNDLASSPLLAKIQKKFISLNSAITPFSKLKCIVKIQKYIILLISQLFDNDVSKVSNDLLLPSFIFIIIYHLPNDSFHDLYLNFIFISNFLNLLDPYKVDATVFTTANSTSSYCPTEKSSILNSRKFNSSSASVNSSSSRKQLTNNLFELLNLNESSEFNQEEHDDPNIDFFDNDKDLVNYISSTYLNNGELNFYLTNFEAILFFLQNVTIDELVANSTEDFDEEILNNDLLNSPLHKLVDNQINKPAENELLKADSFKSLDDLKNLDKKVQEELNENRSRSSSLLNTISNRLSDAAIRVNRSRSNSGAVPEEAFPTTSDASEGFESSLNGGNYVDDNDSSTLSVMKAIIGRLGLVSISQFKPSMEESLSMETGIEIDANGQFKLRRSSSLMNRLSPNHSRTRSSSLDQIFSNSATHQPITDSHPKSSTSLASVPITAGSLGTNDKRNSLSSKVTEFMTKLNNPVTASVPNISTSNPKGHLSNSSLNSLTEGQTISINSATNFSSNDKLERPEYRNRTASLQIMDKWFNNLSSITSGSVPANDHNTNNSNLPIASLSQATSNRIVSPVPSLSHPNDSSATVTDVESGNTGNGIGATAHLITTVDSTSNEGSVFSSSINELTKYQHVDFESLSIRDLRTLKSLYDQLCNEVNSHKTESKTSDEDEAERLANNHVKITDLSSI